MSTDRRRIRAVLFDLGGTLIKTAPIPEILRRILEAYGVHKPLNEIELAQRETEKQLTPQDYAVRFDEFWTKWNTEILKRLEVRKDLPYLSRVILEKWWEFASLELYPDVMETLNHLRQHGLKTGVVTNGFKSDIDEILPRVGLSGYFEVEVGVDAVGKPKPSKKIFLFALNKLNIRPLEAIFVGDSLQMDYDGAEKAGLMALLIDREDKVQGKVRKIRNLTEIKNYLY